MKTTLDVPILFTTRIIRMFCYGFLSVVLVLYLAESGLTEQQAGLLFSFTLAGDAGISLWLTTHADSFGRKRTLIVGALLMLGAGIIFLMTNNLIVLMIAAVIGVISPSGNEIGPFLSVEQASLSQLVSDKLRTKVFAWYNLAGSFSTAIGALAGGWLAQLLQAAGWTALDSYRYILTGYAVGGLLIAVLFMQISYAVEVGSTDVEEKKVLGLHKSRKVVFKLSSFFALDAFAGGLIVQSMVAYWFHVKFGVDAGILGSIFFGRETADLRVAARTEPSGRVLSDRQPVVTRRELQCLEIGVADPELDVLETGLDHPVDCVGPTAPDSEDLE